MFFIYVLLCSDGSLYTGYTNDVEKRVLTHQQGLGSKYVRAHLPCTLLYSESFATKSEAMKREQCIKSWDRAKKIRELGLVL
jgi:putative endonuclease